MNVTVRSGTQSQQMIRDVAARLDFAAEPLGMAGLREWDLHALDDLGFLFSMRAGGDAGIRLFVVTPELYFPTYAPELDSATVAALDLGGEPPVLLTVVHPGDDQHPPTANLLAPIVVNPATGAAMQVVLDSDEWPLRAPFTVAA